MDMITNLLSVQGSELISGLVSNGFSQEQAEGFLPEAASSIMSAMSNAPDGEGAGNILGKIDIASLAESVNLDSSMVINGLQSIIPALIAKFGMENSDIDSLGGLFGSVKKFF